MIARLLHSPDPAIRRVAGDREADPLASRRVQALLDFPQAHPYTKWWGTHWRLVALADLAVPAAAPGLGRGIEAELDWLRSPPRTADVSLAWAVSCAPALRTKGTRCTPAHAWGWPLIRGCAGWCSRCSNGSGRTAAGTATDAPRGGVRRSTKRLRPRSASRPITPQRETRMPCRRTPRRRTAPRPSSVPLAADRRRDPSFLDATSLSDVLAL